MPSLGSLSKERLLTCDKRLQQIISAAGGIYNLSVIEGHRSAAAQAEAVATGHSTVMIGKHNSKPSLAVDCWPYVPPYGALSGAKTQVDAICKATGKSAVQVNAWIRERFCEMAGVVKGVAAMQGIPVRWGGDWNGDGDGNLFDSNFDDLPHFEIL